MNKNGHLYLIGNESIMYGDDLLQRNWTLVAKDVSYFDARYNGYVTKNGDAYVAGSDSRILGLGDDSKTQKAIRNYVKITQSEIAGKAKELYQYANATYILNKDGTLYATGLSTNDNGRHEQPGWDYKDDSGKWVYENKTTYLKIFDNVKYFLPGDSYGSKAIMTNDSKYYVWGCSYTGPYTPGFGFHPGANSEIKEYTFPAILSNVNNIKKINCNTFRGYALTNSGKFYLSGDWTEPFEGGLSGKKYEFEEYTYNITLNSGETIIDYANIGNTNCMILTSEGRLFGYGNANYMGIDRTDTTLTNTQLINSQEINGKKITQIVAGPNWYVAIDEDGRVYGTGKNLYGVLGRWRGTDRSQPNSRYRTAFEWVECPELEN